MSLRQVHVRSGRRGLLAALLLALLAGCGGGGGGGSGTTSAADGCSVPEQNAWLARWMDEWYFWSGLSPRPDPAAFSSHTAYYNALLFQGGAGFPADRWSYQQSTEAFNRFWGDGQTMGYGLAVAGLEVRGQPAAPLLVRHVEPLSPAGLAGVARGDQVLALNGRSAASLIAADDFSALGSDSVGQALTITLRRGGADRTLTLTSAVHTLTPVPTERLVTSAGGQRLGYLVVKDMVSQTATPLDAAFGRFKAAGVSAVVLDLRYNGGGLVSVGGNVASYVAGNLGLGRIYAQLLFNSQRAAQNTSFRFGSPAAALGAPRVYVLTGPRTCSASEQLVAGLRGVGLEVVTVGGATCGKPVGFTPASQCGTTYSAVNFESVNARGEGRYFDGLPATCPVAEDFQRALGQPGEPLLDAALAHADSGRCPAVAEGRAAPLALRRPVAQPTPPFEGDPTPDLMLPR